MISERIPRGPYFFVPNHAPQNPSSQISHGGMIASLGGPFRASESSLLLPPGEGGVVLMGGGGVGEWVFAVSYVPHNVGYNSRIIVGWQ